jgi:hypothetical protein
MIKSIKTLVLAFTGMTSAFLGESCQGDWKQEQQPIPKIAKNTTEVQLVWHHTHVARDRQADAGCCVLLQAPVLEWSWKTEEHTP